MAAERWAAFRRAFNRQPGDAPMPQAAAVVVPNPRTAFANWRRLLDKVFKVEELVGLEESVNSWLPPVSTELQPSRLSSGQLEEYVQSAVKMKGLNSKTTAEVETEKCRHPGEKLAMGGNHSTVRGWSVECVTVDGKHPRTMSESPARRRVRRHSRRQPLRRRAISRRRSIREQIEKEIKEELRQQMQPERAQLITENKKGLLERNLLKREMEELRRGQITPQEAQRLRMELREASRTAEVNNMMMSEFAMIAMGKEKYEEHQGYYDGEMFGWAENRL